MLYKFIHGEPITDIKIGRYPSVSKEATLANDDEHKHRCKTGESNHQSARDEQYSANTHYSPKCSYNTAEAYPWERQGSGHTALCCKDDGRLKSSPLSHYLQEKVSLFGEKESNREYACKASSEAVLKNLYPHHHDTNVSPAAYSTLPSAAVVTTEGATQRNTSKYTAEVIPIAGESEYSSSQVSDEYYKQARLKDPQILMENYANHPPRDLFNPHKYLHSMEQDNQTPMHSPHLTQWQYQQPPQQQNQVPPWQCQQFPQQQPSPQYQYFLPSQLHLQPQGSSEPEERELVVVSPYFPNLPNSKADTVCPTALPTQLYNHVPPHLATSSYPSYVSQMSPAAELFLQTSSKSSRPLTSSSAHRSVFGSALMLENSHSNHEEAMPYPQQLYPDKLIGTVQPNQWKGK